MERPGIFQSIKKFLAGIIAGSADNDPAGITTYSIAGATTGYSLLWLIFLSTPMLIAVQSICARIGDITQKGLGAVIKENFPKPVAYLMISALILTTILMIGADLIGVGAALELVFNLRITMWIVPVALIVWFIVLFARYETISKYLGVVVLVFLTYIISAFLAKPNWGQVLHQSILPPIKLNSNYIIAVIGILGATFTPPLFFWQTKEEIEEEGNDKIERAEKQNVILAPGFIFGQLITLFIMIATASTIFLRNQQIKTAADAASVLEPLAGAGAKYLFALGIVGAGLLAIPVLASSAGYMVAEIFGWRQSLSDQIDSAKGFYIVITLALFVGVEIALSGIDAVQAMLYSQVLGGIVGPFLIAMLLIVANRKGVMGEYTNRWFDNLFGGLACVAMSSSSILLLAQAFTGKG